MPPPLPAPHVGHGADPFPVSLLAVALILVAVMISHGLARRFRQPPVLGELVIGIVVGNLGYWLGLPFFVLTMRLGEAAPLFQEVWRTGLSVGEAARHVFPPDAFEPGGVGDELLGLLTGSESELYAGLGFALWAASNLGVVLLLFMVGLESSVSEMLRVGPRSLAVATVGVVLPMALGYGAGVGLMPEANTAAHLFLGAILTATSVGITARVFNDLGVLRRPEARVVLGAAVIDDVMGLMILSMMVGMVTTGTVQAGPLVRIVLASTVFLGVIVGFGEAILRRAAPVFRRLDPSDSKLMFPLALAFGVAYLATVVELSVIVGAYAAGLILSDDHFGAYEEDAPGAGKTIHSWIQPMEKFLAPIFFVLMGLQVDLASFARPGTLVLALVLTALAVVGKIASGWAAGRECDRLTVGLGMMPRGEVGLIFASVGKSLGVVDNSLFSAVVIVVMMTTLLAPPALKWSIGRAGRRAVVVDS